VSDETENMNKASCSFCGKDQSQVDRLIGGPPGNAFICEQCVDLCRDIIHQDELQTVSPKLSAEINNIQPKEIHNLLDEYIIGQDKAKKSLAVAVYNHYKRIKSSLVKTNVELQKTNILLAGPTGSGKTLLAQTLARILEVPFCIVDATSITEAGYVGEDVENILLRLIQAADYDITKAEYGIIYIDEIDKISRKSANPSITRDVSGEGVQQALLKIIEGCIANVPPQGGRKHPHQELIQIKTDNILFICGGAFEGLQEIISKRISKENQNLGFKSLSMSKEGSLKIDALGNIITEDLLSYGFIPEFVGRIPLIVTLEALDKESMLAILTKPKNAVTKQYQHLFALDGVELLFNDDALDAAAEESLKSKTGARGLRTIIENALIDVMYHLPSMPNVNKCVVDSDTILGNGSPILLSKNGSLLQIESIDDMTA